MINPFWLILIFYYLIMIFTVWLNIKIIEVSTKPDQYWHIVQLYQLCAIYLLYIVSVLILAPGVPIIQITIGYALMYMFSYNSLLNILRKLKISHLGRYDVLSFPATLFLFLLGLIWLVLFSVFG